MHDRIDLASNTIPEHFFALKWARLQVWVFGQAFAKALYGRKF